MFRMMKSRSRMVFPASVLPPMMMTFPVLTRMRRSRPKAQVKDRGWGGTWGFFISKSSTRGRRGLVTVQFAALPGAAWATWAAWQFARTASSYSGLQKSARFPSPILANFITGHPLQGLFQGVPLGVPEMSPIPTSGTV